MDFGNIKRVTIIAGHYGSGKTNIAVNYALMLRSKSFDVQIADLDIVNPYFRTKDAEEVLTANKIRLISSSYANTNVDTPALPAESYSVVQNRDVHSVIDVGGDDRGALVLGRYAPYILEENNFEFLFVVNKYRYLSSSPEDTFEIMKEIEFSSSMKFTSIVNNSNIGVETTDKTVLDSLEYAQKLSQLTSLNVKMTTVDWRLYNSLEGRIQNLMPINLYVSQSFITRS